MNASKMVLAKLWKFAFLYTLCVTFAVVGSSADISSMINNRTAYELELHNEVACTVDCMDGQVLPVSMAAVYEGIASEHASQASPPNIPMTISIVLITHHF